MNLQDLGWDDGFAASLDTTRRTELDFNPFGHLGTGETRVIGVTPIEGGAAIMRQLLERDGKPVTNSPATRREVRRSERGNSVVDDVAAILDVAIDHRDMLDGREAIVLTFKPRRDARDASGRTATRPAR